MTFYVTQKVLFKHCDPAGIVFYPRYFEMINDAVEAFFGDVIGTPFEVLHRTHGVPTVQISTKFQSASRHGDILKISVEPTRIGGASLDLAVTGICEGDTRFTTELTVVYVTNAMRSERWPDAMRQVMTQNLKTQEKETSHE